MSRRGKALYFQMKSLSLLLGDYRFNQRACWLTLGCQESGKDGEGFSSAFMVSLGNKDTLLNEPEKIQAQLELAAMFSVILQHT